MISHQTTAIRIFVGGVLLSYVNLVAFHLRVKHFFRLGLGYHANDPDEKHAKHRSFVDFVDASCGSSSSFDVG